MLSEAVLIKWFVEKLRNFEAAKEDSAKIHEVFDVEKNDVTLIDCMKFQQVRSLAHGGATNWWFLRIPAIYKTQLGLFYFNWQKNA